MSRSTQRPRQVKRPRYPARPMVKPARNGEKELAAFRKKVGGRVDQLRRERELEVKQLCDEMNWDKSEYSRKHRGLTTLTDIDVVKLRRILRAPTGWPYVSLEEGMLIDATKGRGAEMVRHMADILRLLDELRNATR